MKLTATTAYSITDAKSAVGHILVTLERNCTPRTLTDIWQTPKVLKGWNLPQTFDYLWIEEIFVHHEHRRKGLGRKALERLIATRRRPTFIALGPGDIDRRNPTGYNNICRFYKSLGFTFRDFGPDRYAFFFCGGSK